MARLVFATAALLAMTAAAPMAQEARKPSRIAVITQTVQSLEVVRTVVLPELARLGFSDGANLSVSYHVGAPNELPAIAPKVVAEAPDAILAIATPAAQAAQAATDRIPVVRFGGQDAVVEGFAETLARPSGNVTGVVIFSAVLDAKRLELLHETVPQARSIGVLLFRPSTLRNEAERQLRETAEKAGLDLLVVDVERASDYPPALAAMKAGGAQALLITAQAQFASDTEALVALANQARLPTACEWVFMARRGCLLGYGPERDAVYRRVAGQLARILDGARPSEIPVEQPVAFELAVNLRTAWGLGIKVPASILVRADEVIE